VSSEILNWVLAAIALIGLIVNIIQNRSTREETRKLAQLTSELEHRVHRLAAALDQKIERLHRVRDLITGLVQVSVGLRQGNRDKKDKLDLAIQRNMTFPELAALIITINDEQLTQSHANLQRVLLDDIWIQTWNDKPYDMGTIDHLIVEQSSHTREMHRRLLELLDQITSSE
jgi:hypothetical protein